MTELCEWNPEAGRGSYEGEGCPNPAAVSVGHQGSWHLCDSCAALPRFKRYKVRRRLDGSRRASMILPVVVDGPSDGIW